MSKAIDGVTAEFGTAEYYGQWLQMMLQTSILSDSIGIDYKLPQCVTDFVKFVNESRRKPRTLDRVVGDEPLSIEFLRKGLQSRCFHCIEKIIAWRKITTKAQFLDFISDRENLIKTRNFGKKSLKEFEDFMESEEARSYFYD